jgi:TolB-like protein/tetratricopeptide (TPR) repeat protein
MSRPDTPEIGATPGPGGSSPPAKKLVSWKEIAAHLGREVRTVQRWETTEDLPVHRHEHLKKSTVYAYASELDAWFKKRQPVDDPEADAAFVPEPDADVPSDVVANEPVLAATGFAPVSENVRPASATAPELAPPRRGRLTLLLVTAAIVCIAVYGAYHWFQVQALTQARVRLVVLPFKNLSGDASQNYISEGLTDDITTQLGRLDPVHLGVIAPTSAKIMAGRTIKDIGQSLSVQYVLEGSVQRIANRARIDVQCIQVSDETPMWTDSFTRELSDFLQVESDVADTIAKKMKATLPVPSVFAPSGSQPPSSKISPEALAKSRDDYLRGKFNLGSRSDLPGSIRFFEQAIQEDPSYAQAYAGLAGARAILGQVPNDGMPPRDAAPKSKDDARHALQLDPRLAEAHTILGNVAMSYDWDLATAEKELQRAIDLNPNDPTAHEWYCHLLIVRGRIPEALIEARRALDLDPVNPLFHAVLVETYYYGREYDSAIEEAQQTLKVRPDFPYAQFWLGSALREKKMYPQAIAAFQRARESSHDLPFLVMAYGHAQALAGNVAEAQAAIQNLKQTQHSRYVPDLYVAAVYVGLGDKKEAFRLLDLAYDQKVDRLVYLKVEPLADPLRSDPRFAQLLSKIGLH